MKKQLAKANADLTHLFNDLENYSTEQLCKKPAPDSWSAIQVLHHLMLSEKYSVMYCQKKLSFQPKLKKAGLMSALRVKFVHYYLASPLKFKAPPNIGDDVLPTEDTLENIRKIWSQERIVLEKFITDLPVKYQDKEVYRHPFGGRMSVKGMLQFLESHFKHHEKQIYRALKN